jgi:predicted acylesterase/phospholipase RssA
VRFRLKLRHDYWETNLIHAASQNSSAWRLRRSICENSQGIAFGGGGARALSEIGVISELERHAYKFDHVSGTSMGSLIAALYAQGLNAREMSEKFKEFSA